MRQHVIIRAYGRLNATAVAELEVRRQLTHDELMTDGTAMTIASWWQSSGRVGSALASLASGCAVSADALLRDIDNTRPEAVFADDRDALDMLAEWVYEKMEEAQE